MSARPNFSTSAAPLSGLDVRPDEDEIEDALRSFAPEHYPPGPRALRLSLIAAIISGLCGITLVAWLGWVLGGLGGAALVVVLTVGVAVLRGLPEIVAGVFRRRDRQLAERMVRRRHRAQLVHTDDVSREGTQDARVPQAVLPTARARGDRSSRA